MTATGQLNTMFEADTSTPVLPLPEHLNCGIQDRGMHRIPEIRGLYYFLRVPGRARSKGVYKVHRHQAVADRPGTARTALRVALRLPNTDGYARYGLGTVAGLGGGRCVPLYSETKLFERVPDQAIVNEYRP